MLRRFIDKNTRLTNASDIWNSCVVTTNT